MPTRDLGNKRIKVAIASTAGIANNAAPTVTELLAMLDVSEAVRWDGYDFGMDASDQIDDRSLTDDAAATIRGFAQFGGGMPFYFPKVTDTTSVLRQAFNLLKTQRTPLVVAERIGYKDWNSPWAAGDNVNIYEVLNDGYTPDTEGDGGYAYTMNLLSQGEVFPWTIAAPASAVAVSLVGGATATLSLAGVNVALRGATYQSNNIGARAIWSSSAPNIAAVDNHGVIRGIAAGTANITANFPGGLASTACAVTVGA